MSYRAKSSSGHLQAPGAQRAVANLRELYVQNGEPGLRYYDTKLTRRGTVRVANELAHQASQDAPIRTLAGSLIAGLDNVKRDGPPRIARWIVDNIQYAQETPGVEILQGPYTTLPAGLRAGGFEFQGTGIGDCDDLAILFAALCRAAGLNAFLAGISYQDQPDAFHHAQGYCDGNFYELSLDESYGGVPNKPLMASRPANGTMGLVYDPVQSRFVRLNPKSTARVPAVPMRGTAMGETLADDINGVLGSQAVGFIRDNMPKFRQTWAQTLSDHQIDVLGAIPTEDVFGRSGAATVREIFDWSESALTDAFSAQAAVTGGVAAASNLVGFIPAAAAGPAGWAAFGISIAIMAGKGLFRLRGCTEDFQDARAEYHAAVNEAAALVVPNNGEFDKRYCVSAGSCVEEWRILRERVIHRINEAIPIIAQTYGPDVNLGKGHRRPLYYGAWNNGRLEYPATVRIPSDDGRPFTWTSGATVSYRGIKGAVEWENACTRRNVMDRHLEAAISIRDAVEAAGSNLADRRAALLTILVLNLGWKGNPVNGLKAVFRPTWFESVALLADMQPQRVQFGEIMIDPDATSFESVALLADTTSTERSGSAILPLAALGAAAWLMFSG